MNQKDFQNLFHNHYFILEWHANKLMNNTHVAKDRVMKDLLQILNFRTQTKSNRGFKRILLPYTTGTANEHIQKRENQTPFNTIEKSHEEEQLIPNFIKKLKYKIDKLPARLKEVMIFSIMLYENKEIAKIMGISEATVKDLKTTAQKKLRKGLANNSNEDTISAIAEINVIKDEINAELIRYFARHPHKMYDLDPYKFENLVAALMKDMGYDVYHTSQTRDGGRDIIAVMKTPSNDQIVTIVECKRNRGDRVIGIDIVKSFLYTIREQDKANAGWIVTTSSFSPDAINKQQEYKWLLSLKDNNHLTAWCSNYGQWKRSGESGGLWLPNNPLA